MKRFVTYLYEYKNGQRIKNTGHLRVDIRNQMVNIQICIKHAELENETGTFYIMVRDEKVYGIPLEDIQIKSGQYNGRIACTYYGIKDSRYSMQQVIGIGVRYEKGCYMASSWKDEEDEVVARGDFLVYGENVTSAEIPGLESDEEIHVEEILMKETYMEEMVEVPTTETYSADDQCDELMEAASIFTPILEEQEIENIQENIYRKINLNEIHALPRKYWHYSNNSFLIHGFWNYGYLVLKEKMEEDQKKIHLGVPGIFEQPEMVMATYFGFPNFETIPSQMEEMAIGQTCREAYEKADQQSGAGTFGCWFTNL